MITGGAPVSGNHHLGSAPAAFQHFRKGLGGTFCGTFGARGTQACRSLAATLCLGTGGQGRAGVVGGWKVTGGVRGKIWKTAIKTNMWLFFIALFLSEAVCRSTIYFQTIGTAVW